MLALATIVAVGSLPVATTLANQGRNRVSASQIAQAVIEEQRAKTWSALPVPPFNQVLPPVQEFTRRLRVSAVGSYDIAHLRRVTVTVQWRERTGVQEVLHETTLMRLPR